MESSKRRYFTGNVQTVGIHSLCMCMSVLLLPLLDVTHIYQCMMQSLVGEDLVCYLCYTVACFLLLFSLFLKHIDLSDFQLQVIDCMHGQ